MVKEQLIVVGTADGQRTADGRRNSRWSKLMVKEQLMVERAAGGCRNSPGCSVVRINHQTWAQGEAVCLASVRLCCCTNLLQRVVEQVSSPHFNVEEHQVHVDALPAGNFRDQALLQNTHTHTPATTWVNT